MRSYGTDANEMLTLLVDMVSRIVKLLDVVRSDCRIWKFSRVRYGVFANNLQNFGQGKVNLHKHQLLWKLSVRLRIDDCTIMILP